MLKIQELALLVGVVGSLWVFFLTSWVISTLLVRPGEISLERERERGSKYLDMVVCQRHVSRVRIEINHIVSVGSHWATRWSVVPAPSY